MPSCPVQTANCKHPNLLWYQASPTGLYNHLQTVCDDEMTLDFNGASHLWLRRDSGWRTMEKFLNSLK